MSVPIAALPAAFAHLQGFAERWALPSENQRSAVRWTSSKEEFAAFHEAVMPSLDALMDALGDQPVPPADPALRTLYLLACAFAEAAPHHDLYKGSAQVPFSFEAHRFEAAHGDIAY
jgi:hypothetical protein